MVRTLIVTAIHLSNVSVDSRQTAVWRFVGCVAVFGLLLVLGGAREQFGDGQYEALLEEYRTVASDLGEEERAELVDQALRVQQDYVEHASGFCP